MMFSCDTGSDISDIHEELSQFRNFPSIVAEKIRATQQPRDSSIQHTTCQHTILNIIYFILNHDVLMHPYS